MSDPSWWDAVRGMGAAAAAAGVRLFPAIAGSILSLRFMPVGATMADRVTGAIGGLVSAIELAPWMLEVAGVTSPRIASGTEFLTGLFAMAVLGETSKWLRARGVFAVLGAIFSRLTGKEPPPPTGDQ